MKRMKDKILKAINDAGAFIAHYECTRVSLTSHRYIIKAYRENNSLIDIDRVVIDNDHAVFLDEVKKTAQLNVPANMLDNDADMNYLIRVGKYLNISRNRQNPPNFWQTWSKTLQTQHPAPNFKTTTKSKQSLQKHTRNK